MLHYVQEKLSLLDFTGTSAAMAVAALHAHASVDNHTQCAFVPAIERPLLLVSIGRVQTSKDALAKIAPFLHGKENHIHKCM